MLIAQHLADYNKHWEYRVTLTKVGKRKEALLEEVAFGHGFE